MLTRRDGRPLLRHALLGGSCFVLNAGLLWLLIEIGRLGVLESTAIAFVALNAFSHHIARRWIFVAQRSEPAPGYRASLSRYFAVTGATLAINLILMHVAVGGFGLHYLVASLGIAALFFVVNFVLHRDWTFGR